MTLHYCDRWGAPSPQSQESCHHNCVVWNPIWRCKSYPIKWEHSFRKNIMFFSFGIMNNFSPVKVHIFPKQPLHNTLDFKLTGLTVGRVYATKRCCTSLQMHERCGCESCQYMCNTDLDRHGWPSHEKRGLCTCTNAKNSCAFEGKLTGQYICTYAYAKAYGTGQCQVLEDGRLC